MTHRKNIEYWLERDSSNFTDTTLELLESNSSESRWHLTHAATQYEFCYSDFGYITLSSVPCAGLLTAEIREIYHGPASEQGYNDMIAVLADNLVDCWI